MTSHAFNSPAFALPSTNVVPHSDLLLSCAVCKMHLSASDVVADRCKGCGHSKDGGGVSTSLIFFCSVCKKEKDISSFSHAQLLKLSRTCNDCDWASTRTCTFSGQNTPTRIDNFISVQDRYHKRSTSTTAKYQPRQFQLKRNLKRMRMDKNYIEAKYGQNEKFSCSICRTRKNALKFTKFQVERADGFNRKCWECFSKIRTRKVNKKETKLIQQAKRQKEKSYFSLSEELIRQCDGPISNGNIIPGKRQRVEITPEQKCKGNKIKRARKRKRLRTHHYHTDSTQKSYTFIANSRSPIKHTLFPTYRYFARDEEVDAYIAALREDDADEQKTIEYEDMSLSYLLQLSGDSRDTIPIATGRFNQYSKSGNGGSWEQVSLRQIANDNMSCTDDWGNAYYDEVDVYMAALRKDDADEQKTIEYEDMSLSYLLQSSGDPLDTLPVAAGTFYQYSKSDNGGSWEQVSLRQIGIDNIPCTDDDDDGYYDELVGCSDLEQEVVEHFGELDKIDINRQLAIGYMPVEEEDNDETVSLEKIFSEELLGCYSIDQYLVAHYRELDKDDTAKQLSIGYMPIEDENEEKDETESLEKMFVEELLGCHSLDQELDGYYGDLDKEDSIQQMSTGYMPIEIDDDKVSLYKIFGKEMFGYYSIDEELDGFYGDLEKEDSIQQMSNGYMPIEEENETSYLAELAGADGRNLLRSIHEELYDNDVESSEDCKFSSRAWCIIM